MHIAVIGIGKMGYDIAKKFLDSGHEVAVYDQNPLQLQLAKQRNFVVFDNKNDLTSWLILNKAILWLMIPHQFVNEEVLEWLKLLPADTVIIDGGNSDYRQTKQLAELARKKSIHLIDVGTSGGIYGYENGYSLMIGGDESVYMSIKTLFQSLAQPNGNYHYFGRSGSGHYVKMVHNAVEYGIMQAYAEGYNLLKNGPFEINLQEVATNWQSGGIVRSWLNELISDIMEQDSDLANTPGIVPDSGEARWALQTAQKYNIAMPVIDTALKVRIESQNGVTSYTTKLLSALRNKFGGHKIIKEKINE